MRRPIVLVSACSLSVGKHPSYAANNKYVDAVSVGARSQPLLLPPLGEVTDLESVLAMCHGIVLTGAVSNLQASLYGQATHDPSLPQDPARDATVLPLIRAAIQRGIPLLAICRGFQELNVALGGTLHQAVHQVPGYFDHREDTLQTLEQQYGPAHRVTLTAGGMLAHLLDGAGEIQVNSLHGQGIDRLAPGLQVEARADDGLIEAFSLAGTSSFALAVQWHPEWQFEHNPDSLRLFNAFGQACRIYRDRVP